MVLEPADGAMCVPVRGITADSLARLSEPEAASRACGFTLGEGWNSGAKPGRPEGGEVQMAHALVELIAERYPVPA